MNRRSFISLPPACLLSGLLPFPAYAVAPAKRKVVFSGFEPFAKRKVNASFQLAKYLTGECQDMDCQTVEVPVIWGEPKKTIQAIGPGPAACG